MELIVIVGLKAVQSLESAHEGQLNHYLRAADVEVGLLFNFGRSSSVWSLDNERKVLKAAATSS